MEIANYIYSIISNRKMVMWSWGFHKPRAIKDGLTFHVNGFIHVGNVTVLYNEAKDLFQIILTDIDNVETKRYEDIYVDQLINVIDEAVERTTDYQTRVKRIYNN